MQIDRTYASSTETKAGDAIATLNVTCAANLLLKSVGRFKVRSPASTVPKQRPANARALCCGLREFSQLALTWQVTLPDEKQLRLSEDAVLHMRRILDEFSYACDEGISRPSTRQRLRQLLFEFFDTFGSHVFRSPAIVEACWQESSSPAYHAVAARKRPRDALHTAVKRHVVV